MIVKLNIYKNNFLYKYINIIFYDFKNVINDV